MKKFLRSFLLIVLFAAPSTVVAQTLIAGWDFQTAPGTVDVVVASGTNSKTSFVASFGPQAGIAGMYLDGTNGSSTWNNAFTTTTNFNETTGATGTALNAGTGFSTVTTSPAALGLVGGALVSGTNNQVGAVTAADGKAIVFAFSMANYKNLAVSYATYRSATGFASQVWECATSVNGPWTAVSTFTTSSTPALPTASSFGALTLATITALDNATTAYLRITFNGAYGTGGTTRFDNIQFNATPIPTYYSKATGDLSTPANYGTATDGTGTAPTDFNGGGSTAFYQLANRSAYTLGNDLAFGSSATLNIPSGATLDLNGHALTLTSIAGTGTLTGSSASSLTFNGTTSALTFATGKGILANLVLGANANVTLASPLSIAASNGSSPGTLDLIAGGATLNTGGLLTMKSDVTGSAYVKNLNGSTVSGNVTVERYLSDKRAWRLITPSVYGSQTINAAWQEGAGGTTGDPNPGYGTSMIGSSTSNGFDVAGASTSILTYNSTSNTYTGVPNTNTTALSSGQGFFLFSIGNRSLTNISSASTHSATTLRSTGALLGGTQTVPVNGAGFTLVGNPFICPVDFSQVVRSSTVPNSFYAWDATLGTYGGYVLVSNTGAGYVTVPSSNIGTSTLSNIIPTGAAVFVQSDGSTAGSLTIGESAKVTPTVGNPANFLASATPQHNFRVNLTDASSNLLDGVMASFGDSFSNKVDATDALKMTNFYENMSLKRAGKLLTMECRSSITAKDTIFVQLSGMKSAAYQLQIDPASFNSPGMTAYLADAYLKTNTKLDLNNVSTVAFTANTADTASYKNRFSVTFVPTVDALKISHVGASVVAYPNPATNKQVNLSFEGLPTGTYNITMVDSFGHVMQKSSMVYNGTTSNKLLAANYTTGVYTVNIQSAGYNQSIKVIVP